MVLSIIHSFMCFVGITRQKVRDCHWPFAKAQISVLTGSFFHGGSCSFSFPVKLRFGCCSARVEHRGCHTTTSKETPPRVFITLAADNGKLKTNLSNRPLKTALEAGCQTVQCCLEVLVCLFSLRVLLSLFLLCGHREYLKGDI